MTLYIPDSTGPYGVHPVILGIVKNLLFTQQIAAACEANGLAFKKAVSGDTVEELAPLSQLVLIDLNLTGHAAFDLLRILRISAPEVEVIGFVSHVDKETIQLAKDAGLERVMPRSKFFASLPGLLGTSASRSS